MDARLSIDVDRIQAHEGSKSVAGVDDFVELGQQLRAVAVVGQVRSKAA